MRALNMLHVPVDLRALARQAQDRSWTRRASPSGQERDAGFDRGRALHHVLDEAFGPGRLRPFRLLAPRDRDHGAIYAYTTSSEADLRTALDLAPPETADTLSLDRLAIKAMPAAWTTGRRLGFDVAVRPVVRIRKGLQHPRTGKHYQPGSELDAFYVEALRSYPDGRPRTIDAEPTPSAMLANGRSREAVYRDWLVARVGPAATIDEPSTSMERFERRRVARDGAGPEGPDAVFHGVLTVEDPLAFAALLAGGVGRHKAYGYGMLLLRHPSRPVLQA